ncbi:MAG: alpha/beta fold hydrolase [Deltaproteobacteria bacterium]|nr:alpha/beta fold hydrolase [Deltaproteobacteria bacterium]
MSKEGRRIVAARSVVALVCRVAAFLQPKRIMRNGYSEDSARNRVVDSDSTLCRPRVLVAVLVVFVFFVTASFSGFTDAAESGRGELITQQGGITLTVYTYHPGGCVSRGLMLVFHGARRNADDYRDYTRRFARRACLSVYAPLFDRERFKSWQYQRGGIIRKGVMQPPDEWTVSVVRHLVQWALAREGGVDKPVYLFGHSAGGQFLSRVAAYAPSTRVRRLVVMNPSTHVWPATDELIPFGFGWFPKPVVALKQYLRLPVTIYLGSEDTGSRNLYRNAAADRQGANRLERGINAFNAGRALARGEGWDFNWKLVIASGVGHSLGRMLRAPEADRAFGLDDP